LAPGTTHRADDQVGLLDRLFQLEGGRVAGLDAAGELAVDATQGVDVDVEHRDMGAHALGDAGGVVAGDTAADDDDLGRGHAGDAAHQHTAPAVGLHQVVRADLRGQPAGDLAHGASSGSATDPSGPAVCTVS
jgi:hypothetical protein